MPEPVTACLLLIGDEILSGRTQDKNLAHIATRLNEWGIQLAEARMIRDDQATIVSTLNEVRAKYDYVFTTGGIGPTHDDITSESVAAAFGLPHGVHPEAFAILDAHYEPGQLNEARLRMAKTPEGATLIKNKLSKAPGFQVENVFVMAGVPSVMQAMLDSLKDRLRGGQPVRSRSLTVELPEGKLAAPLGKLQAAFPDVDMGSYPFHRGDTYGADLVLRCRDEARLAAAAEALEGMVAELGVSGRWDTER